jgi:hypothetical protein
MKQPKKDNHEGRPRRFDVELLIVHPTIDPAEITAALRMQPVAVQRIRDRRQTPNGVVLTGNYTDTRWRYGVRHTTRDQWFAESICGFIDRLAPHKDYLHQLRNTGGTTSLIVQFLDNEHYADQMPPDVLAKMADLGPDFGIENYGVRQS